ncbi:hypothetical protein K466DRAFT_668375 [Polyporus arcularius HHB13444]|uniref:Uncharacterized protein n=1 Tax=Polyporus arcularius HHB13444 TaxID=1314778 RepID=A0A5C3NYW9_9APHY|nr:hypothetical protein K466DRAFT_668375 [Polyporus arcularius HHB13444]
MFSDDVDFNIYLRDVMSIISYLFYRRDKHYTDQPAILTCYLFDFIVLRCYRKLYARLESGTTLWTKHPLVVLRDFYEEVSMALPQGSSAIASTRKSSPTVSPESFPVVPHTTDTFHVTFSSSTAPAWDALLHDCYTIMYDKLSHTQMVPKPQTKSDEKENKLTSPPAESLFAGEDVSSEIWDIWQDPSVRMPYLTFD